MVTKRMNPRTSLGKKLVEKDRDLLKEMVKVIVHELMDAEVNSICGAGYGERSEERVNSRNGYRARDFDTRTGTIAVEIPKLRQGSYFPEWLFERRRRSEKALISVVSECYVAGVSTRKVDGLVKALGIDGISKSQVSEMAKSLDAEVEAFRTRPLDRGPYPYVWLDGMAIRCRDGGRVVNVCLVIATGVNRDGYREILGTDVITEEDGTGWTAFVGSLVDRGLSGVQLVTSDAHRGIREAVARMLPGASWQRCRTHFMRNLLTRVPRSAQEMVATLVRSIFAQPSAEEVNAQHARVVANLRPRFADAAAMLEDAREDLLAFTTFPKPHWRQIWSNNPQERLNREVRRRTDVVGIFPNRPSIIRLAGAVLAEQTDEWTVTRRYFSAESLGPLISQNKLSGSQQGGPPQLIEAA